MGGGSSGLSEADFCAAVWQRVRAVCASARRCRITYEVDDGDEVAAGVIPVPSPDAVAGESLALTPTMRRVVALFADQDPKIRLKGAFIAEELGKDFSTMRKPLAELVKMKVLESHTEGGYTRGNLFAEVSG